MSNHRQYQRRVNTKNAHQVLQDGESAMAVTSAGATATNSAKDGNGSGSEDGNSSDLSISDVG
jgi:hypothetical protein